MGGEVRCSGQLSRGRESLLLPGCRHHGKVLAGTACWAEITMETWLAEGHWQWLRAGGGGSEGDLCRICALDL